MAITSSQILGALIAIFGFILLVSSIIKISLDFLPFEQDGLFAVGFVLMILGLLLAYHSKKSEDEFP